MPAFSPYLGCLPRVRRLVHLHQKPFLPLLIPEWVLCEDEEDEEEEEEEDMGPLLPVWVY